MVENLVLRIGAIGINLFGSPSSKYEGQDRFQDFLPADNFQASYAVRVTPIPKQPSNSPVFETGHNWCLYWDNGHWIIWVRSILHNPHLAGNFTPDFHSGEIFIAASDREPGKFIFPLSYPLGEILMINLLSTGYGIMLHSCGVIDSGRGIVFAGIGGAGKSTTARLWNKLAEVRVLNDDHTILRKIDGHYRVYGTPWHGRDGIACPDDAPLSKIFIIRHASTNQVVRLTPSQAAAELLVRTLAPHWNAQAMAFTLQFLDELCQAVPCYELGFVPDQSAVEYVRCLSLD